MEQLILHLFGDYVLQSDWMAKNKTKRAWPAIVHGTFYSLPFIVLCRHAPNPAVAFCLIYFSHILIDRYRLARYVVWAKNWLGAWKPWYASCTLYDWTDNLIEIHPNEVYCINRPVPPWHACSSTGYPPRTPDWLAWWLLFICDNTIHLAINYAALRWL